MRHLISGYVFGLILFMGFGVEAQTPESYLRSQALFEGRMKIVEATAADLAENSKSVWSWYFHALANEEAGRPELALSILDEALKLAPNEPLIHALAARLEDRLARSEAAETHYRNAARLESRKDAQDYYRGQAEDVLARRESGRDFWTRLLTASVLGIFSLLLLAFLVGRIRRP